MCVFVIVCGGSREVAERGLEIRILSHGSSCGESESQFALCIFYLVLLRVFFIASFSELLCQRFFWRC